MPPVRVRYLLVVGDAIVGVASFVVWLMAGGSFAAAGVVAVACAALANAGFMLFWYMNRRLLSELGLRW